MEKKNLEVHMSSEKTELHCIPFRQGYITMEFYKSLSFSKNIQITTTRSGEDTPTTIEFTIKGDKIDEKYVRDFEEWKKMCDELKATHPESDDMYAELWTKLGYTVEFIEFDTHTI